MIQKRQNRHKYKYKKGYRSKKDFSPITWSKPLTPAQKRRRVFLLALEKCGQVNKSAEIAGYNSTATVRQHRLTNKDFAEAWAMAESVAFDIMEDEARRRAVDGIEEAIYHQGEIVGYRTKYSDALLTTLLKANNPEKYRDNIRVDQEVSGTFGVAILPATHTSTLDWENRAAVVHESQDALMDRPEDDIIEGEYEEDNSKIARA